MDGWVQEPLGVMLSDRVVGWVGCWVGGLLSGWVCGWMSW